MEDCLQSSEGTARSPLARVMVSGFIDTSRQAGFFEPLRKTGAERDRTTAA
jgi:hypothetical protein